MPVSNKSKWSTSPKQRAFIIYKCKRWCFYLQYIHLYIYIFQLPLFLRFNTRIVLFLSEVYIHQYIYVPMAQISTNSHRDSIFPEVYNHRYIYMFHVPMFLRLRYFYQKFISIGISTCSNGHWHNKSAVLGLCLSRCPRSSSDKPLYVYTAL